MAGKPDHDRRTFECPMCNRSIIEIVKYNKATNGRADAGLAVLLIYATLSGPATGAGMTKLKAAIALAVAVFFIALSGCL